MSLTRRRQGVAAAVAALLALAILSGCEAGLSPEQEEAALQEQSDHFLGSFPGHGEEYALTPSEVIVGFDAALRPGSSIEVLLEGEEVGSGPTALPEDGRSMRVPLRASGPGTYEVRYEALLSARSSEKGRFTFDVDEGLRREYEDERGADEVRVELREGAFVPPWIVVDRGATVVWVNRDGGAHRIAADPHPLHESLLGMDPRSLEPGEEYRHVFDRTGEWAYHCSSHFPEMRGRVIVVEPEKDAGG